MLVLRFVLALLLGSSLAHAQSTSLSGLVVDATGAPVPEARISLLTGSDATTPTARTDADGRFTLRELSPHASVTPLTLRVERPPFAPTDVRVMPDAASSPLRIVLALTTTPETVHVVSPLVDATTVDTYGSTQTVVSEAQVLDLHALDLASALRRTPGVTISRFNPVGAFGGGDGGAVFVRGMGASRPGSELLTSIDGVPFYMGVWGHPLLGLLPVSGIERITVLKGPQPQTFGNALSAVDIETRRARVEGLAGSVRLSGGAFATVAEQADLTVRSGRWDVAAAQGVARSDGHRDDADGRMANGFVRVGMQASAGWSFDASLLHVDSVGTDPGEVGRPDTKAGRYETNGTLAAVSARHAHGMATGTVRVYANRGAGDWFDQPAPDGDTLADFTMAGFRWREDVTAWSGGRVSAGLDVDSTSGDVRFNRVAPAPQTTFTGARLTVTSPFVAVDHTLTLGEQWSVTPSAGLRYSAHSVFDDAAAPHAGVVVRRGGSLAWRVNYARGVNYPGQEVVALSNLIAPLGETWRSLRAERMDHVEAGITVTPRPATTIDAAVFDDRLTSRYVFGFPPVVARPSFVNLGGYRVRGAEVSLRQSIASTWQAFGGLTLLDPTLETLPYAPARALVLGVTGAHGPFSLSIDAQAQSSMFVLAASRTAGAANTQRVDGFAVVNVRPAWRLPWLEGRAMVFAAVENLFDTAYAYRPGYPMPGTSLQVGISIR